MVRLISAVLVLFLSELEATGVTQTTRPDFSGRWQLVEPTAPERAPETLVITAPNQLLITRTPLAITVEHPSKPGTHPEARTFEYGSGGFVGDVPGRGAAIRGTWAVSHIGTQLMISRSTTYPPDELGARITVASGSMWRVETPSRLVIEFREERKGERPKVATRTYVKIAPP